MQAPDSSPSPVEISIIVPVFNVAEYVEEFLDSIRLQSFERNFETLLIDDCSTDDSAEICRRFSERYPGFVFLQHPQNQGVSAARNLGLEKARGRYLMFADPDDILPPKALGSLFDAAERYDADIVKGNLVLFDEDSRRPAPDRVKTTSLVCGDKVLTTLFEHALVRGHVGGKLFRRDRLGAIRFTIDVRMAQDLLYFSEMFAAARSLVLIDEEVYYYRKHQTGSTGRKYEKGSYVDWLGAVEISGKFASSARQRRAHKGLLLRTMAQIARECRKIPNASAVPVLDLIEKKRRQWELRLFPLLFRDRLGLRSLGRYIKLCMALKQVRKNLARS